jgi:peroxiredoxin
MSQVDFAFFLADNAMLVLMLAACAVAVGCAIITPFCKDRDKRKRMWHLALGCVLVSATLLGTQWSVTSYVFDELRQKTTLAFLTPFILMFIGILVSLAGVTYSAFSKRLRPLVRSFTALILLTVAIAPHSLLILAPFLPGPNRANHAGTVAHEGDHLPDFECSTIDGALCKTADWRGKVVVLNFFATWCGPCQMELPHIQSIWNEFRSRDDFRMIVLGREETGETLRAFQKQHGFSFPMAGDPDGAVFRLFASNAIPRTYLISRDGTVLYESTGFYEVEIDKLRNRLQRELAKKQ